MGCYRLLRKEKDAASVSERATSWRYLDRFFR